MGVKESNLIKEIQMAVSKLGWRLFRNQTGTAWQGRATRITETRMVMVKAGSVILEDPRFIDFGLVKGGHDLVGFNPIVITPEMVGQKIARFTTREVKTGTLRSTSEQNIFTNNVNAAGGDAKVVRSVEEALL